MSFAVGFVKLWGPVQWKLFPALLLAARLLPFAAFAVRSARVRLAPELLEAGAVAGLSGLRRYLRITLPLLAPAIVAAALLGFALSIDDFVITYFNAGGTQTFPVFVWGIARVAVPPQVNVVASFIFLVAIAIALGNVAWQYRAARRTQGAT
jgi:spermidine/putrescine transport system permease protein